MTLVVFVFHYFLGIAMITLKLWQLADLALPLIILLGAQLVLIFFFTYFVVFNVMGRDYDAAVLSAGTCGFGMGATPNAIWQTCRLFATDMLHQLRHTF